MKNLLPIRSGIFPVYSVIVFWSYSWGLLVFMFNLSSWILKVPLNEILGYFSYMMVFLFLDTIILMLFVLSLSAILPRKWLRDDFEVKGTLVASTLFLWIVFIQVFFNTILNEAINSIYLIILIAFVILVLSMIIVKRIPRIQKVITWFASAAGIFVYLYGFLTIFSLVIVIIRNI
jgi:drug/metabolite transporter (DMT)-like permease